jgi:hypothetical protein
MKINFELIAQILAKAETFLTGSPVTIPVAPEVVTIDGVTLKIALGADSVTIQKV